MSTAWGLVPVVAFFALWIWVGLKRRERLFWHEFQPGVGLIYNKLIRPKSNIPVSPYRSYKFEFDVRDDQDLPFERYKTTSTRVILTLHTEVAWKFAITSPSPLFIVDVSASKLGMQPPLRSNDPILNSMFGFRGEPRSAIEHFLQSKELLAKLHRRTSTFQEWWELKVVGNHLIFRRGGRITDEIRLLQMLDDACDYAEIIETSYATYSNPYAQS